MLRATEIAGFIGAGLAGAAYVPQIWHLIRERCSAGLSRVAFSAWLAASLLVMTHAIAIDDGVFVVLGAIQLAATALILIYTVKFANSYCASHLPVSSIAEPRYAGSSLAPNGVLSMPDHHPGGSLAGKESSPAASTGSSGSGPSVVSGSGV